MARTTRVKNMAKAKTASNEQFERLVTFEPAYDERDSKPSYSIGCAIVRFYLKGPRGVVQFVLYTGWHLPHVQKELLEKDGASLLYPFPTDLGYHSPVPRYEGQISYSCDLLPGKKCYYDGSGLNAQPVYETLVREGDEAMWNELEEYYKSVFEEEDDLVTCIDEE